MEQQVHHVIADWVASAELVVQPECEVGERPRSQRLPDVQPAGRGRYNRVREQRIVVEVKAPEDARAEGHQRDCDQDPLKTQCYYRISLKQAACNAASDAQIASAPSEECCRAETAPR